MGKFVTYPQMPYPWVAPTRVTWWSWSDCLPGLPHYLSHYDLTLTALAQASPPTSLLSPSFLVEFSVWNYFHGSASYLLCFFKSNFLHSVIEIYTSKCMHFNVQPNGFSHVCTHIWQYPNQNQSPHYLMCSPLSHYKLDVLFLNFLSMRLHCTWSSVHDVSPSKWYFRDSSLLFS